MLLQPHFSLPLPVSTEVERVPLDRFPRGWGVKQRVLLSCRDGAPEPFVFLTQHGDCLHSGTSCRPMQFAGIPIRRSLCRFCFERTGLPPRQEAGKDKIVCMTRSGHYVHSSEACRCLDRSEEIIYRKLCKCCKWG